MNPDKALTLNVNEKVSDVAEEHSQISSIFTQSTSEENSQASDFSFKRRFTCLCYTVIYLDVLAWSLVPELIARDFISKIVC